MRQLLLILAGTLLIAVSALGNSKPIVSNLKVSHRPHTSLIDVQFDVTDPDDDMILMTLQYSLDNGDSWENNCVSVTGDIGSNILPTANLIATWDAGIDLPDFISNNFSFRIIADDGSGVMSDGYEHIIAGTFLMGSPTSELGRHSSEVLHQVTLTTDFYMKSTEVTNQEYVAMAQWAHDRGYCTVTSTHLLDTFDGSSVELFELNSGLGNVSYENSTFVIAEGMNHHPVQFVTWYGAVAYCDWLSLRAGLDRAYDHSTWACNNHDPYNAEGYRLPTEAEWEYACRAGSTTAFSNGIITDSWCGDIGLAQIGWYCGNSDYAGFSNYSLHPVKELVANLWGLYDMHGNLNEYCNDWSDENYIGFTDPSGPSSGTDKTARGGFFAWFAYGSRSASRWGAIINLGNEGTGFRPVTTTHYSHARSAPSVFDSNRIGYGETTIDIASGLPDNAPPLPTVIFNAVPNPFNPHTTISYSIANKGHAELIVFDHRGRTVRHLVSQTQEAGSHVTQWDGHDDLGARVSNGVYLVRLKSDTTTSSHKVTLLK